MKSQCIYQEQIIKKYLIWLRQEKGREKKIEEEERHNQQKT